MLISGLNGHCFSGRPRTTVTKILNSTIIALLYVNMMICFVCCTSTESLLAKHIIEEEKEFKGEDPSTKIVRRYSLYNRCSGGYLQMYLNQVNARGKYSSPLVNLRVESDTYGSRIRIQNEKFGKYLCFNRRKRIISKYNGKHKRCVFIERLSENHYTELESAWSSGLYIGFNHKGRFLDPRQYNERRYCFQYIKTERMTFIEQFQKPNYGPPVHNKVRHSSMKSNRRRLETDSSSNITNSNTTVDYLDEFT